jgi:uncharacterized repeat protein (TIGR01451 family)
MSSTFLLAKPNLFFTFLFIIAASYVWSQDLQWVKKIGGPDDQYISSVKRDSIGNLYISGTLRGTADFDAGSGIINLTSSGQGDAYVSKYDAASNFIWAKKWGGAMGEESAISYIDPAGYVYITGGFLGIVDFDPGPGVFNLTATNGVSDYDLFISKLDPNGNFVWAKRIGAGSEESVFDIYVDQGGYVYLTGSFEYTVDFNPGTSVNNLSSVTGGNYWVGDHDAFILKLDNNGNYVWAKKVGARSNDYGISLQIDAAGFIYIAGTSDPSLDNGSSNGPVDYDPGAGTYFLNPADGRIFLLKLDTGGNFVWAKNYGGRQGSVSKINLDHSGNIYTTGSYSISGDFDPGSGIYNLTATNGTSNAFITKLDMLGDLIWAKKFKTQQFPNYYNCMNNSITIDDSGRVYSTGIHGGTVDLDPGSGTYNLTGNGADDAYLSILDSNGNFVWAHSISGTQNDLIRAVGLNTSQNEIYLAGQFSTTVDFEQGAGTNSLVSLGNRDAFISLYKLRGLHGSIYNDLNSSCSHDSIELKLAGRLAIINPGGIIVQTDHNGNWYLDSLAAGTYTISADTSGNWTSTCGSAIAFSITNTNDFTSVADLGIISNAPCSAPDVSVNAPFLRRCFNNQRINISATNLPIASGILNNGYIELGLNSLMTPGNSSIPYVNLGNDKYKFQVDTLYPGQMLNFWVEVTVSCAALLYLTICMEAKLLPVDNCIYDTIPAAAPLDFNPCTSPWDGSSLVVDGWCQNDSIYFTISNSSTPGNGNMNCYSPVRLYVDGQYMLLDSVQLAGGTTDTLVFSGDGRTWRLETDQHPLHPGNSHPNITIELCGDTSNWTPGLVNLFPQDDADPNVDIFCGVIRGSFDPNLKTGYPLGITNTHYVAPNGQIDYTIHFQNTGTDTAFTVVVRDTLDADLDILSVCPGASSHPYSYRIYGPRILEWTFTNIMLPDSTTNQAASHGLISFSVKQQPNLSNGTNITNEADIYFDYNEPIITNAANHVINNTYWQQNWNEEKTLNASACSSYYYNGIIYTQSGSYWQIISGNGTGDTLVNLNITIQSTNSEIFENHCENYTAPDGVVYTTSGVKTAIIPNAVGCDSIITIHLSLYATESSVTTSICNSYTAPDGTAYTTSGVKTAVIPNVAGCDSTITIYLTITHPSSSFVTASACDSYTAPDGVLYTTTGVKTSTITNVAGCDSTIIINLIIHESSSIDTGIIQNGSILTVMENMAFYQWIDCSNNTPIAGQTNQSYTATSNGVYAVEVSQNGCTIISSCFTITEVGINETVFSDSMKLSPNPTTESIYIDVAETAAEIETIITNTLGQEISRNKFKNTSQIELTIEGENGIYFLTIIFGTKTVTFKIIKQS